MRVAEVPPDIAGPVASHNCCYGVTGVNGVESGGPAANSQTACCGGLAMEFSTDGRANRPLDDVPNPSAVAKHIAENGDSFGDPAPINDCQSVQSLLSGSGALAAENLGA